MHKTFAIKHSHRTYDEQNFYQQLSSIFDTL